MLLWVSLLVLAPVNFVSGQFATEPKSVISLHPPWTTVFQGEKVTLTCKAFPFDAPEKIKWYHWYLQGKMQPEISGNTHEVYESGDYKCQAQNSLLSNRVELLFSSANLILQAPSDVFENESVLLRCRAKVNTVVNSMRLSKNGKHLEVLEKTNEFHIHQASLKDNGDYHCTGVKEDGHLVSSNQVKITVQELFPSPVLRASSTQPTEGDTVTLTCETRLSPQRSDVQLQFYFFSDSWSQRSDWRNSPEFQIHTIRSKESGSYWCQAQSVTPPVQKYSQRIQIQVKKAVPDIRIYSNSQLVFEGQELVLICSVNGVSGPITISWYRKHNKLRAETKPHTSRKTELKIPVVQKSDAGEYYCVAKDGRSSFHSDPVTISVQVPVSQPVLTLSPPGTRTVVGDEVSLQCEVPTGSLPISYQFFHGGVLLKRIEGTLWRTAPYRFSLTAEHSGNYYCTADNGLGPQSSEAVRLSVTVPVSQPVLTLSPPGTRTVVGDEVSLQCEVPTGSLPISYQFFRGGVLLKRIEGTLWRTAPYRFSLTAEHSGNYYCTADNGLGPQSSEAVRLSVTVPVSQPVLTLSPPGTRTVVGDEVSLQCKAQRGSLPISYQFYREGVLLTKIEGTLQRTASYSFSLTAERSGNYYCTADNGLGPQSSEAVRLSVIVPVSRPVLTLRAPRAQAVVGDVVELHCEARRGSPPILYRFYREDAALGSSSSPFGAGASFNFLLTVEHSGNYFCEASNVQGTQRSDTVSLSVRVPVSRPVLTLRAPRAPAVVGDMVELHCETRRGSPPILYRFYHEDVALGSSSSPSEGGVSFSLPLTTEHSGNYSCEAANDLGAQRSEVVPLNVIVPVSRPVLTFRAPRAQAVVGDMVELHCEAQRGSPPILYQFYHENVTLGNNMSHSGQGVSLKLSLTTNHSGTYSCAADNGLGPQCSEAVTLFITGLTGGRSSPVATGVTGGLLGIMVLAAVALLFYWWLPRKAGGKPTSDSSSNPSALDPQEPTYHNVPSWIELQPVYSNVNPNGGDVVYSEVRTVKGEDKQAAASTAELIKNTDSCVIYSQVKGASTAAPKPQLSASSTPHR
ncbi:Fc receptor-like protein 5 [Hippopotamus amphibius kiboko]|uniref:Fc receptor-like protein 5 n=1 Tax=Hippopotamus amphibius kiboko TaxID=575201 RepID=UPI00259686E2|nr:Fc receptor-like protein 5 [Hippopotamus amphibius kiboko]